MEGLLGKFSGLRIEELEAVKNMVCELIYGLFTTFF